MINNIKRNTYWATLFLSLVLLIYLLPNFIDRDHYRKTLSYLMVYIFYPSLFISTLISIRNFVLIRRIGNLEINKWVILNSLVLFFFIYYIIKAIIVLTTPVGNVPN